MGRRKKIIVEPSKESVEYVLQAVREYPQMREFCDDFEHTYPVLLRKGEVDTDAFCRTDILAEETFVMPELAPCDMDKLDVYLSYREKVYLLECGLERIDDTIQPVAESLLFKHLSWDEVMKKHSISRMTVSRYRKAAVISLAKTVDDYMTWKARKLYL